MMMSDIIFSSLSNLRCRAARFVIAVWTQCLTGADNFYSLARQNREDATFSVGGAGIKKSEAQLARMRNTETSQMNPFDLKTVLLAKHAQHVVLIHFPIALFI